MSIIPANAQTMMIDSAREPADAAPYIRYHPVSDTRIDFIEILEFEPILKNLESAPIQFGPPAGAILVRIDVKNAGDSDGDWILYTGRGALKSIRIWRLDGANPTLVLDGWDLAALRENLTTYLAFSNEFSLSPGEAARFAIIFEPRDSTYLPLKIQSFHGFFTDRWLNIALVSGVVFGALVLVILNLMFFSITGQREFIWLGLAESAFLLNTLHTDGYTTVFLFPVQPELGAAFADIVKCSFAIFMSQFARTFIATGKNFPWVDRFLKATIFSGIILIVLQLGYANWPETVRRYLLLGSWFIAILSAISLPFVGIIATRRLGAHFAPLIIAWGSLGAYVIYAAIASAGVIPGLPVYKHLGGPIGLFECAMATMALGLHIRKIQKDRVETDAKLNASLTERLHMSEQANRLANEHNMAIATVNDQNTLLHASGHDSQQVITALKSAIHFIDTSRNPAPNTEVRDILRASADYLENIVSTSMSMPIVSVDKQTFIAISGFTAETFCAPLRMIYERICRDKGLKFLMDVEEGLFIISDRALLMRIVSNYLGNAFKFTESGTVTIKVSGHQTALDITISDTGAGINPNVADDLNSRKTGRKKGAGLYSGTGSGYLTSKQILESLGGKVNISPGRHGGTRVEMTVPLVRPALTPCSFEHLSGRLSGFELLDADNPRTKVFDLQDSVSEQRVILTYDDSAQMRRRLSEKGKVMILKPLYAEMLDHSVFKAALK